MKKLGVIIATSVIVVTGVVHGDRTELMVRQMDQAWPALQEQLQAYPGDEKLHQLARRVGVEQPVFITNRPGFNAAALHDRILITRAVADSSTGVLAFVLAHEGVHIAMGDAFKELSEKGGRIYWSRLSPVDNHALEYEADRQAVARLIQAGLLDPDQVHLALEMPELTPRLRGSAHSHPNALQRVQRLQQVGLLCIDCGTLSCVQAQSNQPATTLSSAVTETKDASGTQLLATGCKSQSHRPASL